jgi:hypothetical protein
MTTRGIREFDENKVPTEHPFCAACFRIVVEEYKAALEQRIATLSA